MEFVGREDPVRKLRAWLLGDGLKSPLSIVSISGPGGIGKTWLLKHVMDNTNLSPRNYLTLKLTGGGDGLRNLGQVVCYDLIQSCSQLDSVGKSYFNQTRKNLRALCWIDAQAQSEVLKAVGHDTELRKMVHDFFRAGAGLQDTLPFLKKRVDLSKMKKEQIDGLVGLLERTKAYCQETRWLGGTLPDLLGAGRRNRLRAKLETTLAADLYADLSVILLSGPRKRYRLSDIPKPMPSKVAGLDRLLLIIDDYESLQETLNSFLVGNLVPLLAQAKFETLILILGRDKLSSTHSDWKQQHESVLVDELKLTELSREEAEQYVRSRGIVDDSTVCRILEETEGYPYLLAGEVADELDGGRSALHLKGFYDRQTRWMTSVQKVWLDPLCFLDEINEETVYAMLPEEEPGQIVKWFEGEASIRNPRSKKWQVLRIIRSRICEYIKNESPKRFRELQERARLACENA